MVSLALSIAREQGRELVAIEVAGRDVKVDQVPRDGEAYLDTWFAIGDEAVERGRRENLAERSEPRQTAEQEVGERLLFVYRYDGFEAEQREHQLASAVSSTSSRRGASSVALFASSLSASPSATSSPRGSTSVKADLP